MRGRGRFGNQPQKPSLALRAAAFQQHMAKMFTSHADPILKPRSVSPPRSGIKKPKPKSKPVGPIPTSTIFESNSVADKRERYFHNLTLAEQLGIVEPPPAPLTNEQFETVKIDAQKRGFYNESCPICLEKFGPDNLVLLSCSHLLHATCLMNFRKFTRGQRHLCPVCRSPYEFVEVKAEGAYHDRCARLIQRVVRGFLIRDKIGREAPPGSYLHRRWVISKAQDASTRLVRAMDNQSDAVDAMLSSIDADLEYARSVMRAAEERDKVIDWDSIKFKCLEREDDECPVCLRKMAPDESSVTSCGHMFHTTCLNSWLSFCQNQNNQPTCPVCRAIFQHVEMIEKPKNEPKSEKNSSLQKKKPESKRKVMMPRERAKWH
ncbi:hypothetical protein TRFO_35052 [Tritrichomonas foetus]|uniref:RING-type domain-containing protein n=1 Tax=Tritrichomonas foetus TaxID=1144522 RepID=A0A1J4JH90_9EUKA|nr:hypothetical protein TRFO_35052 [Tritrichomonas foetus]|eukprot:OHS98520.1 hypothetical protein TRFO_35052 [Tritrichomonas foetus]